MGLLGPCSGEHMLTCIKNDQTSARGEGVCLRFK